ncbi:ADA2 protein with a ZZ finger [Cryptosporidium ryanae]|uniref:ADA2 protein with a ZZ finger n=1 Tax=Cryptosporidium ryanae TaxID=515981 RepID=UPI00351A6CD4|nr:ADA2 protein with a ZZ finger [Cryptosporidium ryanae]
MKEAKEGENNSLDRAPDEALNLIGEDIIHPNGLNLLNTVEISTLSDPSLIKNDLSELMEKSLRELEDVSRKDNENNAVIDDLNIIDGKFRCDVCKKDTWDYRIRCAECTEYDLCLDCFCQGKFSNNHKPDHKYIPIGRYTFNLLTNNWTAEEELLLMEAVSRYGLGNWSEISKYITEGPAGVFSLHQKSQKTGYGHSADECEKHYNEFYLNSQTKPLPDTRNYLKLSSKDHNSNEKMSDVGIKDEVSNSNIENDNISEVKGDNTTVKDESDIQQIKKQFFGRSGNKTTSNSGSSSNSKPSTNVVGYMPLRGDFDVEYDNDAELLLADMEFRDHDTPQERELKLQILEIYNSKLDERTYRKRFVIERNLLDIKQQQQKEKKRTKDERDLHSFLKPISRFQTEEEQEKLVSLLIEEKRIRNHLQKVQEWCSIGIRTLEEVKRYEEEKKRREDIKCKIINQNKNFSVPAVSTNSISGVNGNNSNLLTAPNGLGLGNVKTQPKSTTPFVYEGQARTIKRQQKNNNLGINNSGNNASSPNIQGQSTIPIESYPGASLLTTQEKAFCDQIQLPPIFYILSKRILMQEAKYQLGLSSRNRKSLSGGVDSGIQNLNHLSKDDFSRVIRLDAQRAGQLYDFCLSFIDK